MMWDSYPMGHGMFFWLLASGILMLALIAAAGYLLLRRPQDPGLQRRASAETLLDERYARGEIDEQEYRQRLITLRTQ